MVKPKTTRSTKLKEVGNGGIIPTKVQALRKVFYIAEQLLQNDCNELRLERFYHPGKNQSALFITCNNEHVMEVLEFNESRRSWLIDSDVCSNGRIYLTTPIDITFLVLHHLRKHCKQRALALDSIVDSQDPSTARLLTTFVREEHMRCVADVRTVDDMMFYKYNPEKTLAWLAIKTQRIAIALREAGIHAGHSAQSLNYTCSEIVKEDVLFHADDYLRMACDYVGGYLDLELHEELTTYLEIPSKLKKEANSDAAGNKRKSLQPLNNGENKKVKLEATKKDSDVAVALKDSSLLDDSLHNKSLDQEAIAKAPTPTQTPLKERSVAMKEKAFAKSAKGTRSIASFFKK